MRKVERCSRTERLDIGKVALLAAGEARKADWLYPRLKFDKSEEEDFNFCVLGTSLRGELQWYSAESAL